MLKTRNLDSAIMNAVDRTRPLQGSTFLHSSHNWLWVIPILLLVTLLSAPNLNGAFWVDEIISVDRAGGPLYGPRTLAGIWEHTAQTAYDQVPGYYVLLALWDNLLGWSEFSSRLLSLMAGLLAVAWTYRLGRDLHSPLAGLGAALAVGSSALFIVFTHEARTYALAVLLGAMAIWLYWRIITRPTRWLTQAALVLVAAGLLYSHYFASLLVFSLCLYHLLFRPKNREWWRVVVLMGLAGVLFLPWVLTSFDVIDGANSQPWRQAMGMSVPEFADEMFGFFGNGGLALLLIMGIFAAQTRNTRTGLIWFTLLGPLALAVGINLWLGMLVSSKFLLYLWVPMGVLFGIGTANLARRDIHPALIFLPWLLVGLWGSVTWQEDPIKYIEWDVMADQLRGHTREEDAVVFHLHATEWDGAHQRAMPHYFSDFPELPELLWTWPEASDDPYLTGAYRAVDGAERIWSSYDPRYRHQRVDKFDSEMIGLGYADCGLFASSPVMAADLFAQPPDEAMPYQFGGDMYDDGIRMVLVDPLPQTIDDTLRVAVGWQMGSDVPVNTYSFGLHVLDLNGELVAQQDVGLPPQHEFGCQVVHFDPLPLGEYDLSLLVYAWETGERLDAVNNEDDQRGDHLLIGTFTVP